MRRTLALAVSGLALAAFAAPIQSASAVCTDLSWAGGPSCFNPCGAVLGTYERADEAAKDRLPEHFMHCFA